MVYGHTGDPLMGLGRNHVFISFNPVYHKPQRDALRLENNFVYRDAAIVWILEDKRCAR
jgi:hypothetical protein